jgi:hypothetical protein
MEMHTHTEHRTGERSTTRRTGVSLAAALLAVLSFATFGAGRGTLDAAATPDGARVDLETPTFSDPTSITNPLFPRDTVSQVVQVGAEGKDELRFEITYLPDTKFIRWNGQRVETRVTHFVAYMNGRILEVATDFYAQADDGSVWYFGEDVDNYENGVIVDHEGTWLAGKDGPPGMIMPADPEVGDVYRPENIPGLVFEEVTVRRTDLTVAGPRGPVHGAISVRERLMDGTTEDKNYAPGYGEFHAEVASLDELYDLAVAVPIDALGTSVPGGLRAIDDGTSKVFDDAPTKRWHRLTGIVDRMTATWDRYRARGVPELLETQMTEALGVLDAAVGARDVAELRQAAIGAGHAALDLQMQFRGRTEVDRDRLGLWRRQVVIDRAAGDEDAVIGDIESIQTITDRLGSGC